jgi:hypothetical protein
MNDLNTKSDEFNQVRKNWVYTYKEFSLHLYQIYIYSPSTIEEDSLVQNQMYKILDPKVTRFGLVVKKIGNILRILCSILNFVIKKTDIKVPRSKGCPPSKRKSFYFVFCRFMHFLMWTKWWTGWRYFK